jgi:hypothetical protein
MIRAAALLFALLVGWALVSAQAQTARIIHVDVEWPQSPDRPIGLLPADEMTSVEEVIAMRGNLARWRDKEREKRGVPKSRSNGDLQDAHRGAQQRNPSVPPPMKHCPPGRPCYTVNSYTELNLPDDGWIRAVHGVFLVVEDSDGVFQSGALVYGRWQDPRSLRGGASVVDVELIEGEAACGVKLGRVWLDSVAYLGPTLLPEWRVLSANVRANAPAPVSGAQLPFGQLRTTSSWGPEEPASVFSRMPRPSQPGVMVSGRCLLQPDGRLGCGIAQVSRQNAGYSAGFYRLVSKVRAEPNDRNGQPIGNRCITISMGAGAPQ